MIKTNTPTNSEANPETNSVANSVANTTANTPITTDINPTKIWGPPLWISIHNVALGFPENPTTADREQYRQFYELLGYVIPCQKCATNYRQHTSDLPIDQFLYNRKDLFRWTVLLHNIVNKSLGKRQWTLDEAWSMYNNFEYASKCGLGISIGGGHCGIVNNNKNIMLVLVIVIVVLLLLLIHSYMKK